MKSINLSQLGKCDISFYLALEEYLEKRQDDFFFVWNLNKSVIIGRNQIVEAEVNIDQLTMSKAKLFRRKSGGGAVFADQGCFMYSFVIHKKIACDKFCDYLGLIIDYLKKRGLDAYFSGRNDLMYEEKKFSGCAFYSFESGTVIHGTFLYDTNLDELANVLTPSPTKIRSKGISSIKQRVINLKPFLNCEMSDIMSDLVKTIGDEIITLEVDEIAKIKEIEEKFKAKEWIYRTNIPYSISSKKRFAFGEVRVGLDIFNNRIKDIEISGDFFQKTDLQTLYETIKNVKATKEDVRKAISNLNINDYIEGLSNEDFINLIEERIYE